MKARRVYTQTVRAEAVAATRQRIIDATVALAQEKASLEIVLADVAERAGVSVQTVLRHFGSRDGLFEAASASAVAQVVEERAAPVGDVPAAVRIIFDHYEQRGDAVLRFLAQEAYDARIFAMTEQGREVHRDWVRQVFAPVLADRSRGQREALTDLLVVATDVYTWKLLRRDRRLSRRQAEARVTQLVTAIIEGTAR